MRRLDRLAEKYWDDLPWRGEVAMERDGLLGKLEQEEVSADVKSAESRLDDLAIIELFSIFEGIVRTQIATQVRAESTSLTHPMLKAAAKNAVDAAERRSFAEILNSYSQGGHANLAEQVRQVRRYRNWISHGRRGKVPIRIEPKTAYERLRKFLELISPPPPPIARADETIPEAIP
jgi:hypothetical protein